MKYFVRGALASLYVGVSWHFYVARANDRIIVIDTGSDEFAERPSGRRARQWRINFAISVPDALAEADIRGYDVTDVVLTHRHWDHCEGLRHFPRAVVHMHRQEWASMCLLASRAQKAVVARIQFENRTSLFDTGSKVVAPGLCLEVAGSHTAHHLVARVLCSNGPAIVGGDAAYMYMNIESGLPITATDDPAQNLADVLRLSATVERGRFLPGHDPAVFSRFRLVSPHVAIISE